MKLRINLYPPECYPKRQYLDLYQMVMILGGSLLLLLGLGLWLGHQASGLAAQVREQDALQQQMHQAIEAAQAKLGARVPNPQLQAELKSVGDDLLAKQALLEHLHDWMPWRSHGFAQTLEDLARIHSASISLKRIEIEKQGLSLTGTAASSAELPAWLARFSDAPSLAGKQFNVLAMARDKKGILQFELSSQRQKEQP